MAYYRTEQGRFKKALQNAKRKKVEPTTQSDERPNQQYQPAQMELLGAKPAGSGFDPHMVSYLRMVTSLIEDRRLSRDEILEMLARILRQHSMARRNGTDYFVWYLNRPAP